LKNILKKSDFNKESDPETIVTDDNSVNPANKYASIWKGKKTIRDYCGKSIAKETVKIYYFTRVLFGSLISKDNSFKNRRY
jgi:hypothetical protein